MIPIQKKLYNGALRPPDGRGVHPAPKSTHNRQAPPSHRSGSDGKDGGRGLPPALKAIRTAR